MLVRADSLATPATAFEPDRRKVEAAIQVSRPGSTALNLDQALAFARRVQGQDGRRVGEIAFISPGRTAGRDPTTAAAPPRNLRVIGIPDNIENVGLRRVGTRRSPTGADRTTVMAFIRDDHPGALLELLTEFAVRGVNLTRIESRPTGVGLGRYYFSIDAEGHVAQARVAETLAALRRECADVRFLGSYPRADGVAATERPGTTDLEFSDAHAWVRRLQGGEHTG